MTIQDIKPLHPRPDQEVDSSDLVAKEEGTSTCRQRTFNPFMESCVELLHTLLLTEASLFRKSGTVVGRDHLE